MVTKNKNINITPSKGISIVIKNDFQPDVKPKKKRKIIPKANPQSFPSYIPPSSSGGGGGLDVSYIKPQYNLTSLNRNMFFPGTPQSLPQLPPPPPLPQLMPPPELKQLMPPPPPVNISFDNMFGNMMDSLMPREFGFKKLSYDISSRF